jgi:hypothetical protein
MTRRISPSTPPNSPPTRTKMSRTQYDFLTATVS